MAILKSASKIVFLLLTITACGGFFIGVLSPDNFMILASSAFAFYFSNKGTAKDDYLDK
jgi:glucokinase